MSTNTKSLKEWWGPKSNGLVVMYVIFSLVLVAFVVFLVLWLIDEAKPAPVPNYSAWQGTDRGLQKYFGLDIAQKQFLTYNATFEVVGADGVDVSGDFTATLEGPPIVKIRWIQSKNLNVATIILDADSPTQRTVQLSRLTLQSLTPAFNSAQNVAPIPRLFNTFY